MSRGTWLLLVKTFSLGHLVKNPSKCRLKKQPMQRKLPNVGFLEVEILYSNDIIMLR